MWAEAAPFVSGLRAGERGTPVHVKGDRTVWRVAEDGRVWYAKGGTGQAATGIRDEVRIHGELARRGLPVATPLAAGAHDGLTWIVTREAPGRVLDAALRDAAARGDRRRVRALCDAAARLARDLHAQGFRVPDLTAPHVFVTGEGASGGVEVTLIDVARATLESAPPAPRQGSIDLAALLCSLPAFSVGRREVVRLVSTATGARGDELRAWFDHIARRARKLRLRTRWRHAHADVTAELSRALGDPPPESLYDTLLAGDGMQVQRRLPDRENRRFDAPGGRAFFMKLYPPVRQGLSPAMHELDALDLFARSGLNVCAAAGYGEDLERGSFVLLRGCDGEPLDDLLRGGVTPAERRALCAALAALFRGMRCGGVHHRDAYPCHVFAARRHARGEAPRFELRLIDLTRAGVAPFPRERWLVKDVAQLWYGLPRPPVTRTDAVRFLRAYFDVPRLDAAAKRFARKVWAKSTEITRRQERRARRGDSRS